MTRLLPAYRDFAHLFRRLEMPVAEALPAYQNNVAISFRRYRRV